MVKAKLRRKPKHRDPKRLAVNPSAGPSASTSKPSTPKDIIAQVIASTIMVHPSIQAVEAANEFEPRQALKLYRSALAKLEKQHPTSEEDIKERLQLTLEALQSSAYILLEQGDVDGAQRVIP